MLQITLNRELLHSLCITKKQKNSKVLAKEKKKLKGRSSEIKEFSSMADKIFILIIYVDLSCCCCRKKIQEYLSRIQCRESILGIEYDAKKNVVVINGPFNPHELKCKLMCKLPRVIKCIEIKEEVKEQKQKCKDKGKSAPCPDSNITVNITVDGACTSTGTGTGTCSNTGSGTNTDCCFRPCPCPYRWNNYYRCCSCGVVCVWQGGYCYGATPFPLYDQRCNSSCEIVLQDYPASCSIM